MKRNRLLYGCMLLGSLLFIYFYGGKIPYMLFYIVLLLPILSLLHAVFVYFRLRYSQEITRLTLMKEEPTTFLFTVRNRDCIIYPYITVRTKSSDPTVDGILSETNFSLMPFSEKTFRYDVHFQYRGVYYIGIDQIDIYDFLCIFKLRHKLANYKYVTVKPRILPVGKLDIRNHFNTDSLEVQNNGYEDFISISDIRKYAYGDTAKRIHWKLSSKMNEWMVKNYNSTSETSTTFVLDLKKNEGTPLHSLILEDKLVECAVSVLHYCVSHWIPVDLIYHEYDLSNIAVRNTKDFEAVYDRISRLSFAGDTSINEILKLFIEEDKSRSNAVIFTANLSYTLYDHLYKIRTGGADVILFYISAEDPVKGLDIEQRNILSCLPEIGVSYYKINMHDNLKDILER